jgi:hypothetical protein
MATAYRKTLPVREHKTACDFNLLRAFYCGQLYGFFHLLNPTYVPNGSIMLFKCYNQIGYPTLLRLIKSTYNLMSVCMSQVRSRPELEHRPSQLVNCFVPWTNPMRRCRCVIDRRILSRQGRAVRDKVNLGTRSDQFS